MNSTNKVALVTGGAHRVGKSITMGLAQAGFDVVINYNSSADAAKETARQAEAEGVQALSIQCDVSDHIAVQAMGDAVTGQFGGVDIIVNAASLFGRFKIPTTKPSDIEMWHQITNVSINGPFYVCNSLAPILIERAKERGEPAVIVNIVDLTIWQAWANFTAHAVGKSGLLALTRQLAVELAPHVRVNAVAPGLVMPTPDSSPEHNEKMAQRNLLKRWGSGEDVAQAVLYLVEAKFVSGEVLKVDAGEQLISNT